MRNGTEKIAQEEVIEKAYLLACDMQGNSKDRLTNKESKELNRFLLQESYLDPWIGCTVCGGVNGLWRTES